MIYNNELAYYKPSRGLQRFEKVWCTEKYKELLMSSLRKASIHGMQQLDTKRQRVLITSFWLILVVCATFASIGMYLVLSERHNEGQLKTVVETSQLPVYNVEFPAVAVCPWNRINWVRLEAGGRRFLPANASTANRAVFKQVLIAMAKMAFGRFHHLGGMKDLNLEFLKDISLSDITRFFAKRCDEIFEPDSCEFDGTKHDCCKLFIPEYNEKGICLTFNSLVSEEARKMTLTFPNYPWNIGKAGEGTGLKFTLRHNSSFELEELVVPFAFTLMIKTPHDWSTPLVHFLYPNTNNFISVNPQVTVTSRNTKGVQPSKRRCLFDEEKPIEFHKWVLDYSKLNCLARCRKWYLRKLCNCTTRMYFPDSASFFTEVGECNPTHLPCFYKYRDIFSYVKVAHQDNFIEDNGRGMLCDCLPSCSSISHLVNLNVKRLQELKNNSTAPLRVKAEVHFAQRTIVKYSTSLEYTLMDLLGNFGGILGLFLGASALSLVEVCFVLIKLLVMLFNDRHILLQTLTKKMRRKATTSHGKNQKTSKELY